MIERGELHLRPEQKKLREQILFLGTSVLDHDDRADSLVMALDLSFKKQPQAKDVVQRLRKKSETVSGNLWRAQF